MRSLRLQLAAPAAAALTLAFLAAPAAPQEQITVPPPVGAEVPVDTVVLQGLDKITARISTFEAPLNHPVRFGSLEITARTCHKTPPEEPPERAVFLEIIDVRPDSPAVPVFTGWMFASSPALSSLEHPVYDVWVVDCKMEGTAAPAAEAPAGAAGTPDSTMPESEADSAERPED